MTREWTPLTRTLIIGLVLALIGAFIYVIQPIIPPLIIAGLIAYILTPLAHSLAQRFKWRHRIAATLVYFIFLVLLIAAPSTIAPILINELRTITTELSQVQTQVETYLADPVLFMDRVIFLDQVWVYILGLIGEALTPAAEDAVQVLETTSSSLISLIMILVSSYYFLVDWSGLRDWLIRLFPEQEQSDIQRLLAEVDIIWWAYVRGTLVLMLIMGIVFIIIGTAIGLPGAFGLGLLTGLLSMIPEIGPIIAAIIASLVALVEGSRFLPISNLWFALLVMVIYIVIMQIKSLWLRPIVMGRFMHMNTGLAFVAIIGAIILQGVLGALVVLPVLATVGIIGRYIRARLLNLPPWGEKEVSSQ
ncbi:MAG: AI-2E family transporter [Chloroflexi bacterium]|nr:AI-2E family transporter [Chloroflexota bacterium]MBP8055028.1 AI-2E family transporter [Chloroflexota bacterium]